MSHSQVMRIDTYGRFSGFKVLLSSKPEMAQNSMEISHITISEAVASRTDNAHEWRSIPTLFYALYCRCFTGKAVMVGLGKPRSILVHRVKASPEPDGKVLAEFLLPPHFRQQKGDVVKSRSAKAQHS